MGRAAAGALALASGVSLALCLPLPGLCPLGWVGLSPLFYALAKRPRRESFALGWLAGAAFHAVAFYWIYSTCRFALVPIPIGLLAWALLAGFQGLAWGIVGWLGRFGVERLPAPL